MSIAEITTYRAKAPSRNGQSGPTFRMRSAAGTYVSVHPRESGEPETDWSVGDMVWLTTLTSLPDAAFRVVRPIRAVVRRLDDDNYLAEAPDAEVCASGDTADEAIRNLEDMVAATFGHFSMVPKERLGRIPARQLEVLQHHIRRR
jgi:predicted RNase H-like HicB family nuclease